MDKQEEKTVDTDIEIENIREFLLENQDIKLEDLPRYEESIAPEEKVEIKLENLQEVNQLPFFEFKTKKKQEDKPDEINKKRVKIALNCFAIIGAFLLSLVAINGVTLAIMKKDIKDNQKDIATLQQEIVELENQGFDVDASLNGEARNEAYKLALPRNYPDDTEDLTWFDKLSIFLMKLFG